MSPCAYASQTGIVEVLRIERLSKHFGGVVAVEDFSLAQHENEITGIIGPNGAGKTTVFNLITGVYPSDSGRIAFMKREITRLPSHTRTGLGISRTFLRHNFGGHNNLFPIYISNYEICGGENDS